MGPHWIGRRLFCGRLVVAHIAPDEGTKGVWRGFCHLPGGRALLGPFNDERAAAEATVRECNIRCKAMFGAGMKTTELAVHEGRSLRQLARVIMRVGVWTCDRPADVPRLWRDLAAAIGMSREDAPAPLPGMEPAEIARSSAGQVVDRDPGEIEAPDDWQPSEDEAPAA